MEPDDDELLLDPDFDITEEDYEDYDNPYFNDDYLEDEY